MKVPVRNQPTSTTTPLYRSVFAAKNSQYGGNAANVKADDMKADDMKTDSKADEPKDRFSDTLLISRHEEEQPGEGISNDAAEDEKNPADAINARSEQNSDSTGAGSFKVTCSIPDDSTGQLASMLARAETKMDVQQVSSKAAKALSALKMASVFAEGDDAKKVTQRIRRMEKLINRISKKQQQLNKEETLELQRKSAERRKEMKRAQEIKKELDGKRTKRRRDERNYAAKENAQDEKEALQEMYANMAGASASTSASACVSAPELPAMDGLEVAAADLSAAEGISMDITV